MTEYTGYLRHHVPTIRALHDNGRTPREISEQLYYKGVSASSHPMTREEHINLIRQSVVYILRRLKLEPHKSPPKAMVTPSMLAWRRQRERNARWTDRLPGRVCNVLGHVLRLNGQMHEWSERSVASEVMLAGSKAFENVPNAGRRTLLDLRRWLSGLGYDVEQW